SSDPACAVNATTPDGISAMSITTVDGPKTACGRAVHVLPSRESHTGVRPWSPTRTSWPIARYPRFHSTTFWTRPRVFVEASFRHVSRDHVDRGDSGDGVVNPAIPASGALLSVADGDRELVAEVVGASEPRRLGA